MVTPATGTVVLVSFAFSDLSQSKLRPAIVLAGAGRGDWILCQVTSKLYSDARAIALSSEVFRDGSLQRVSYARPGKLFTASDTLMMTRIGSLKCPAALRIIEAIVALLHGSPPQQHERHG